MSLGSGSADMARDMAANLKSAVSRSGAAVERLKAEAGLVAGETADNDGLATADSSLGLLKVGCCRCFSASAGTAETCSSLGATAATEGAGAGAGPFLFGLDAAGFSRMIRLGKDARPAPAARVRAPVVTDCERGVEGEGAGAGRPDPAAARLEAADAVPLLLAPLSTPSSPDAELA